VWAQVAEYLHSKNETQSSNPSVAKTQIKKINKQAKKKAPSFTQGATATV
jgi:hypothetical protein